MKQQRKHQEYNQEGFSRFTSSDWHTVNRDTHSETEWSIMLQSSGVRAEGSPQSNIGIAVIT